MIEATAALPVPAAAPARKPWYRVLYVQVLVAIVLGVIVGWLFPDFGRNDWIKALGDGFVKLIRMVIAPIIFCTVVSGIAHVSEVKKGRPGRDQGAGLFRGGVDLRARSRSAGRQPAAARRGILGPRRTPRRSPNSPSRRTR